MFECSSFFLWEEKAWRLFAKPQGPTLCFCAEGNNTFKGKRCESVYEIDIEYVILKADISVDYVTSPSALTGDANIPEPLDVDETYASVHIFLKVPADCYLPSSDDLR